VIYRGGGGKEGDEESYTMGGRTSGNICLEGQGERERNTHAAGKSLGRGEESLKK